MTVAIHHSDCLKWLADYDGPLFDACVTDPPYHLTSIVNRYGKEGAAPAKHGKGESATGADARASRGFMGKEWDGGDIAFRPETWAAIYERLKPGAYLVAFSGTRTYHRMACAIEDAGFEIRDQLQWIYGSGFPKSHDVEKSLRKVWPQPANQNQQEWLAERSFIRKTARDQSGYGTALKPACEPICLARKPLSEKSIAANVLKHGTGGINVDACRVEGVDAQEGRSRHGGGTMQGSSFQMTDSVSSMPAGRWPANIIHDGSDDVLAGFPDSDGGGFPIHVQRSTRGGEFGQRFGDEIRPERIERGDSGSAARFFYSAKAGPLDRIGTAHPTVKPVDLMRWLCKLITPPGGHILEPFAGSGKTLIAAMAEGFDCTGIDIEADHVADIERQLAYLRGNGATKFAEHNHARAAREARPADYGPLFGGDNAPPPRSAGTAG